ncbi:MAG: transcription-repair coupling factor, partial [candidate division Zixibacteria bacterium]|nr:transcription-repair coupling factor [candidate division Zixibacteria bacterium]
MPLERLLKYTESSNALSELVSKLADKSASATVTGYAGSGKGWLQAGLSGRLSRPLAIITSSETEAENTKNDLAVFLGEDQVKLFPGWEINPLEAEAPEPEVISERLECLNWLMHQNKGIVVIPMQAIFQPTLSPSGLKENLLEIKVGQELELASLLQKLEKLGFNRTPWVEEVANYSNRGGIVDIFAYSFESPVRIEFFGDRIESIRTFSVLSQRSQSKLNSVIIPPPREFVISAEEMNQKLDSLPPERRKIFEVAEYFQSGQPGWEWLAHFLGFPTASILDYLPADTIVIKEDPELLEQKCFDLGKNWNEILSSKSAQSLQPTLSDWMEQSVSRLDSFQSINFRSLKFSIPEQQSSPVIDLHMKEPPAGQRSFKVWEAFTSNLKQESYAVFILCDSAMQKERLQEILSESWEQSVDGISWEVGQLEQSFISPQGRLAVLTDHDILGRKPLAPSGRKFKEGLAISSYKSLTPGDFVVHIDYGIGKFQGLNTLLLDGRKRECLELIYAGDDKLYVPIEEFNLVQKFIGKEGDPVLTRLGGTTWEKVKARTKKAIVHMAEELLKLYAERKSKPGFAFSPDNLWQKELEAAFPFQETEDQLKSIQDVKSDLEKPHPMDRLVCGDVGYGKTEVALRAAFKSVTDHKQVAVLVPTTILALQHINTFSQRLANFPVRVEMLSRFKSRADQKKTIEEIQSGTVDIVIGTHMILQDKVRFRDLGLLIIDEEHRFGVAHKEKIKKIKRQIDVLTLTATPIPRTMQMALFGARDMSLINTPPPGRQAIHTEILKFDPDGIRSAIVREINRGGQIFFVHNRIETIEGVYRFLKELLPELRIATGHGQMHERKLEKRMSDFINRKYDLLLSTTIIESGLDISNVNTIIINRADRFGLAELYQLRGRVGRSDQKAYAYLLVPPEASLQETARKRLKALEQFSELGSGFHLALKDLEIRGAGNLLGPQQHGYIEEVGIDLYFRLLETSI